jgi:aspartate ammonia-lyase
MRKETDFIGTLEIPENALYGIHSARAKENFPDNTPFQPEWYKAVALVKLACYKTYQNFKNAALQTDQKNLNILWIEDKTIEALQESAIELSEGRHFEHFIVPAIQGGAGTSINMNVNEIITNRALQMLGMKPGDYNTIDPIEQANIYQSTNDVIPTSLKVVVLQLLNKLEEAINILRAETERLERLHLNTLRVGYTQMQEAVPSTYGRLFSTYSEALSRDWWRVSKCFERIKVVNLGGGAIGSGLSIPRFYIMEVVQELQKLTYLPVTRGESLQDATNNLDAFVEIHAILKAHAVNLEKMVSDIRLLASDITSNPDLTIPKKQVGSSIMPGKINPVIPEFVISATHRIYANDSLITSLCAQGCIDLNAYLPITGHAIIESIKLLISADESITKHLLFGLQVNTKNSEMKFYRSPSITNALSPYIGYHKASELAKEMKASGTDVFEANKTLNVIAPEKLIEILTPQNLLKLGFSIKEL